MKESANRLHNIDIDQSKSTLQFLILKEMAITSILITLSATLPNTVYQTQNSNTTITIYLLLFFITRFPLIRRFKENESLLEFWEFAVSGWMEHLGVGSQRERVVQEPFFEFFWPSILMIFFFSSSQPRVTDAYSRKR